MRVGPRARRASRLRRLLRIDPCDHPQRYAVATLTRGLGAGEEGLDLGAAWERGLGAEAGDGERTGGARARARLVAS